MRVRVFYRFLLALLLLAGPALACASAPAAIPVPLDPEVRQGMLNNGLRYYLRRNDEPRGRAELRLVVRVGSALEDDHQRGLAHFLEHMAFNGTQRFPKNELVNTLQSAGVKFGADLNAYTGFDKTVYQLQVPTRAKAYDNGLVVLREWAGNMSLTDADIEAERGVVLAELRSASGPSERVLRASLPRVFNGSRYADRLPIGNEASLRGFSAADLRRFHRDWYRPGLMAVIVVGDIDLDLTERRIHGLFGDLEEPVAAPTRPGRFTIPARSWAETMVLSEPELPMTSVRATLWVRPSGGVSTVDSFRRTLQQRLINRMLSLRLLELTDRPERPFLTASAGSSRLVAGYSQFAVSATLAGDSPLVAARQILLEVERARRFGFTAGELERARREMQENYARAYAERKKTRSAAFADELVDLAAYGDAAPGIDWEYRQVSTWLPTLTLTEINEARGRGLQGDGQAPFLLVAGPPGEGRGMLPTDAQLATMIATLASEKIVAYEDRGNDAPLLAQRPVAGKRLATQRDAATGQWHLRYGNGLRVTLIPTDYRDDEILLSGLRPGGHLRYPDADARSAQYAAPVASSMGYGVFTPLQLQRKLQGSQVDVRTSIDDYAERIEGRARPAELRTLLELLTLKMTQPRRDPTRYEQFRQQLGGVFAGFRNSPQALFEDRLYARYYDAHPRAMRLGQPEDVAQIDLDRALAIYRERLGNADGFEFVLVGKFDPKTVLPLLDTYLGGLPGQRGGAGFVDRGVRPYREGGSETQRLGNDAKASLIVTYAGDTAAGADAALRKTALVDILQQRLLEEIREDMGSAYAPRVSGNVWTVPNEGYDIRFVLELAPTDAAAVEQRLQKLIDDLVAQGPRPGELARFQQVTRTQYPVRRRSNGFWIGDFARRVLTPTLEIAPDRYLARVAALTDAQVQATARDWLRPERRLRLLQLPAGPAGAAADAAGTR